MLKDPDQPIAETYLDSAGVEHSIDPSTIQRLRGVLGMPSDAAPNVGPIVARRGQAVPVTGELLLEGGGSLQLDGAIPEDCPLGYHSVAGVDGRNRRLIVATAHAAAPRGRCTRILLTPNARGIGSSSTTSW